MRLPAAVCAVLVAVPTFAAEKLTVDPEKGNNTFSAVFDAPLGERINAVSSRVKCDLTVDDAGATVSGTCSVPLATIEVDNEPTKTEHFHQWATNKKGDPKTCQLEAKLDKVKLAPPLGDKPSKFSADVPFTVCGRARQDGGKEHVEGSTMFLPDRPAKTWRVRARIEKFNRESYHIGPRWTDGWFSRVQQLAPVVAPVGSIDFSLFASSAASK